jgi:GT2 family glycosyltransferase
LTSISVGIVILNWNQAKSTIRTLTTLCTTLKRSNIIFRIVIVDNGSILEQKNELSRSLANIKKARSCDVELITNDINLGYGAGMNMGAKVLSSLFAPKYFWFLNNDIEFHENCAVELCNFIVDNPGKKIIGPTILSDESIVQCAGGCRYYPWLGIELASQKGVKLKELDESRQDFDYIYGAAPLIDATFFESINGFDKTNFLYFEELGLASRCSAEHLAWCNTAYIYHRQKGSEETESYVKYFCVYHAALSCFRFTSSQSIAKTISVIIARLCGKAFHSIAHLDYREFRATIWAVRDFFKSNTRKSSKEFNF